VRLAPFSPLHNDLVRKFREIIGFMNKAEKVLVLYAYQA
jgi:hypothetical protein